MEQQLIVRTDVARTIGHDALVEITERALSLGLVVFIGIAQGIVGTLPEAGQGEQLLMVGQGRVLDNVQGFGHGIVPPCFVYLQAVLHLFFLDMAGSCIV